MGITEVITAGQFWSFATISALKRPSAPPPEGLLIEMLRKRVGAVPDSRP
jgi:hypothetical protein